MNLRLGRSGIQDGISACALSLTMAGVFAHEAKQLYSNGNTAYYTLPAAIILSLLIFLLLSKLIKRSGAANLCELLFQSADRPTGFILAVMLFAALVFAAYSPLSQFLKALHGLFFEGVSYSCLSLYILAPVLLLCLLGFETITRTAKLYSFFLAGAFAIVAASASPEFEFYRLYPVLGAGGRTIAAQTIREMGTFLPPLIALLTVADGLNGIRSATKIGVVSCLISAVVCAAAHLSVGLNYTYKQLNELFMPLFKLNHLNLFESHLMRFDKLANIIWLNGAMLSAAFELYAASRLFAAAFRLRDIRPAVVAAVMLTVILLLLETESVDNRLFAAVRDTLFQYGTVIVFPVLTAGLLAAVRSERRPKCADA